jgi:hypothetical protein
MPLSDQDLEDQIIRAHEINNIWLLAKLYADAAERGLDQDHNFFFGNTGLCLRSPKQSPTEIKTACLPEKPWARGVGNLTNGKLWRIERP